MAIIQMIHRAVLDEHLPTFLGIAPFELKDVFDEMNADHRISGNCKSFFKYSLRISQSINVPMQGDLFLSTLSTLLYILKSLFNTNLFIDESLARQRA